MSRSYQVQLEQDYQDIYSDYVKTSELVLGSKGKERQAYLVLRKILHTTLYTIHKELENF